MKYRILTVALILIALFAITVNANGYEYTISPTSNFTSAQYGDDLSVISQKLNMSTDELNAYFNQNGLIYLAVSDDNKSQIKLSVFTDNFSSAAGDISNLSDEVLSEFVNAVCEDGENNADIILNNGRKFICVKNVRKDSGGVYTVTHYITICNSKTFYFAGYNGGEDTSNEIITAFKSFSLQEKAFDTPDYTIPSTLIIIGVIVFLALAVLMIWGIIKSSIINKTVQGEEND